MFEALFGIDKDVLFPVNWETSLIKSRTKVKGLIDGAALNYVFSLLDKPVEHEDLLIIKDREYCQRSAYVLNGLCARERVQHLVEREGCAIYLRWLEKYDAGFNELAHRLDLEMAPLKFNFCFFYSPVSNVLFDAHFDAHDAFILQLEGSRRWQIWPAIVSEVVTASMPRSYTSIVREHVSKHAPSYEITLETGDVMYLPRCTIHRVLPATENSSHLNVWMTPKKLRKFMWEI